MNCRLVVVITVCCWAICSVRVACAQMLSGATPRSPAIALATKPANLQSVDTGIARDLEDKRFQLSAFGSGPALDFGPSFDQFGDLGPVSFSIISSAQSVETSLGRFQETGAEVRLGKRLKEAIGVYTPSGRPTWYMFAGGGGQAITYTPGANAVDTPGGAIRLQDRVRVGRMQAGLAIEHHGVQAALAYVRQDINIGDENSRQQHFAGVQISFKH